MEGCFFFLVDLLFYDFYLLPDYLIRFKTTDFPLYFSRDLECLDLDLEFLAVLLLDTDDLSLDDFLVFPWGIPER